MINIRTEHLYLGENEDETPKFLFIIQCTVYVGSSPLWVKNREIQKVSKMLQGTADIIRRAGHECETYVSDITKEELQLMGAQVPAHPAPDFSTEIELSKEFHKIMASLEVDKQSEEDDAYTRARQAILGE